MITHNRNKRRGRGLSLIEVAMALGITAIAMVSVMQLMTQSTAQVRASATADRISQVLEATQNYVSANYTQLVAAAGPGTPLVIPVGRSSPTGAIPGGPSGLPSIQGGGFLPSSYVDVNPFGQRHAVLVREPSTNMLEVMITTYGGRSIPDGDLGRIASKVGAVGGFMMANQPGGVTGNIQGAYGGWRVPASTWANSTATPQAGRVMATLGFNNGEVLNDYLYRRDIGQPEANRMHTGIDMNGNPINNVSLLTGSGGVLRVDRDLNVGRNIDAQGTLVTQGAISTQSNVTAANDVRAFNNLTSGNDVIAGRDFYASRNSRAIGSVQAGTTVVAGSDVTAGRDVGSNQHVTARFDMAAGRNVTAVGSVTADGNVTGKGGLLSQRVAVPGAACPTNGLIGRTANGQAYSCVNGVWSTMGSLSLGMPVDMLPPSHVCPGGWPLGATVVRPSSIAFANGKLVASYTGITQGAGCCHNCGGSPLVYESTSYYDGTSFSACTHVNIGGTGCGSNSE